mmetsp:Transcript_80213/g.206475  ORF Transcript_80213/g.206475 Transcript_80213/m.206475 type:complete len:148 (+) Transcript_80213:419-862(+)
MPQELESHQVALKFKEGLPFMVDRPLVEMMLQHGHFDLEDVDDDAVQTEGPLEITGFYIDSGVPREWAPAGREDEGDDVPWYAQAGKETQEPAARGHSVMQGLALAGLTGCAALLVSAFVVKRSPRRARYAPSPEIAERLDTPQGLE